MDIKSKVLQESNRDVESMIEHLDGLIVRLKKEDKFPKDYLQPLHELYQESVVDFLDKYIMRDVEISEQAQVYYEDLIYDLILTLKVFDE